VTRLSRRSFVDIDGISLTDGLGEKSQGARFDPRTEFGQRQPNELAIDHGVMDLKCGG
jgi:hypothetical protein